MIPGSGAALRRGLIALLPLALVAGGFFARGVASRALHDFTDYESPFAFPPVAAPTGPPLSRQVVVVLVDGLGLGPSRGLPFLDELRHRGADYDCGIGLPSLSLPGRAVLLSGAWQEVNGQVTNYHPRPLRVETVFAVARRQGLMTALAAGTGSLRLFQPGLARRVAYPKDAETAPFAVYEETLRRQAAGAGALLEEVRAQPGLVMVELNAVDEAGHGWGGASAEYARAATEADAIIRGFASSLHPARDTLVVTADHGHVAEGGHGGPESSVMHVPFVLAGAGVRAGARGAVRQVDVAPTLCALLGLPLPSSNQGRPVLDALALDPARRVEALRAVVAQRERFVAAYVRRLRTLEALEPTPPPAKADLAVVAPPPGADEAWYVARLDALDAAAERAKEARIALEARARVLPALLLVIGPPLFVLVLVRLRVVPGGELGRATVAGAGAVALYHAVLPLLHLEYSLTAVNKDEWLAAYFRKDMVVGVAACAVGVLAAAVWRARGAWTAEGWLERARLGWLVTAAFAYGFVLKMAAVYWRQGVFPRWELPDLYWGFGFYLDVLVVMAVGLASPLMALPAWAARGPAVAPGAEAAREVV